MWDQHAKAFLTMLHGPPPWPFVRHSTDQTVVWQDHPYGVNFVFVHRNRGICQVPGFTSLNADFRNQPAGIPWTATADFRLAERAAVIWALDEPVWPSAEFYRRQQMLNTFLGTPSDHAGLARLLPLPGNDEFPCEMVWFEAEAKYNLDDFKF